MERQRMLRLCDCLSLGVRLSLFSELRLTSAALSLGFILVFVFPLSYSFSLSS